MRTRTNAAIFGRRPSVIADPGSEHSNLGKRKRANLEADGHGNAKLQEYLEVMQLPSKCRIWANEDSAAVKAPNGRGARPTLQVIDESKNDKDYENPPKKLTKPRTEEAGGNLLQKIRPTSTADVSRNMNPIFGEGVLLPSLAPPPPSDEDWLRSRSSRLLDLVEDDDTSVSKIEPAQDDGEEAERTVISESSMTEKVKDPTGQADEEITNDSSTFGTPLDPNASGRLFVRNLPYTATDEEIKSHFESIRHNSIIEVSLTETSCVCFHSSFDLVMNILIGTTYVYHMMLPGRVFSRCFFNLT